MHIDIITIFPDQIRSFITEGIFRIAQDFGITIRVHDLRDWTDDRHKTVDDRPFGGGPGRHFYLASPSDPGLPYLLLASTTTSVGTPTCGGTLPLDATPLLTLSLTPGLIFQNSFGVLDSFGASLAPRFDLPSLPSLVGIGLEAAFVVLDPAAPCLVRRISNAHALLIHG